MIRLLLILGCLSAGPDDSALAAWRAMLDAYVPPETYGMAPYSRPWPALLWSWTWREVPPHPYPWTPYTPWLPGDLTFSGAIGEADLLWFRNCQAGPDIAYPQMLAGIPIRCDLCDLDEDGDVDQDDFGLLQARVGECAVGQNAPGPLKWGR